MSGEEAKLGTDVFLALASVAWADGKLDGDEADAIVRAALDAVSYTHLTLPTILRV